MEFHHFPLFCKGNVISFLNPLTRLRANTNQEPFWQAFGTLDALVDVSTGILSVLLFWDLNMDWKVKIAVTIAFSSRLS